MSGERTIQEIIRDLIDLVKRHPHQSKALENITIQLIEQRLATTQEKLAEAEAFIECVKDYIVATEHWQIQPHDQKERVAFMQKLLPLRPTDALQVWFRERTELIYQRLEALSLDVDSEWLKEALATLKKERGESPNGG